MSSEDSGSDSESEVLSELSKKTNGKTATKKTKGAAKKVERDAFIH